MADQLTHWKKLRDERYLGAYSLEAGKNIILTIASVAKEIVKGEGGKEEMCSIMKFREPNTKPMVLNATNSKMLQKLFKSPYVEYWVGGRIEIYADYNIKFGKDIVEGLRIVPVLPAPEKPICNKCNSNIQPAGKLNALQVAEHTQRSYGMPLCAKCATAEKAAREAATATDVLGAAEQPTTESTVTGQGEEPVTEQNNESEKPINEDN